MGIVTKKGDGGETSLRYGRRVQKTANSVEAYGTVDELGSFIGFAKALLREMSEQRESVDHLSQIQSHLFAIGGDLATSPEDRARGKSLYEPAVLEWLDQETSKLESRVEMKGFVVPGEDRISASLHIARAVSRRAERDVLKAVSESEDDPLKIILPYLNRLSDFLWLLAESVARKESA